MTQNKSRGARVEAYQNILENNPYGSGTHIKELETLALMTDTEVRQQLFNTRWESGKPKTPQTTKRSGVYRYTNISPEEDITIPYKEREL